MSHADDRARKKEAREFWAFVARTSRHVRRTMPDWMTAKERAAYWKAIDDGRLAHPADFYNA